MLYDVRVHAEVVFNSWKKKLNFFRYLFPEWQHQLNLSICKFFSCTVLQKLSKWNRFSNAYSEKIMFLLKKNPSNSAKLDKQQMICWTAFTFISLSEDRILKFYIQAENSIQLNIYSMAFNVCFYYFISIILQINCTWKYLKERIWCLRLVLLELSLKCTLIEIYFQVYSCCIFLLCIIDLNFL